MARRASVQGPVWIWDVATGEKRASVNHQGYLVTLAVTAIYRQD